jgi:hypothetical protein
VSEPKLELCGEPAPEVPAGFEPCPLEAGHEGPHLTWTQSRPGARRGRNGVLVLDHDGERVLHASFDGAVDAEMVCALLAIRDAAHKKVTEREQEEER